MSSLKALWFPTQLGKFPLPAAKKWPLSIGVIAGVLLSYWLYANTLSVPYLQEDVSHINWLQTRNIIDPFLSAEGAPAYRPLGKSIIKFWYVVLGEHHRPWLRYHNIVLNALAIALIGRIGSKLDTSSKRYWTGGIAAVLFGTYPFTYQAVPWINNFFYPMENFLLLSMLAAYWHGRTRNKKAYLLVALFLCALSPFEIEYGVVAAGLLMVLECFFWLQGRQPAPWLVAPFSGLALNIGYVAIWFTIPKSSYAFGGPTLERVYQIGHYFFQGLTYPVSPLAQLLRTRFELSDFSGLQLIILPTLVILSIALWRSGRRLLLLTSLAFFLLLNLPAFVFVDFDYVINSPRLLYPAGMGVVWLWGALLAGMIPNRRTILGLTGALLLALTLWQSSRFVQARMHQYHMIEEPVYSLLSAVEAGNPEEPLLVVNFPAWLAPKTRTFAVGNHGIQLVPFYIGMDAYIYAHTNIAQVVETVQFDNILNAEVPYYVGVKGDRVDYEKMRDRLSISGDVVVVDYSAESISLNRVGRITGLSPIEPTAIYNDSLTLAGSSIEQQDNTLSLTLQWHFLQPLREEATMFVHLYGPDGQLVTQADGDMLGGIAPVWLWDDGQLIEDVRTMTLPDSLPAGAYRIGIGVYNRLDGARYTAATVTGEPIQDNIATVFEFTR